MRAVVFLKQVPPLGTVEFNAAGHVDRVSRPGEMNPFCRRAVSQATSLVAQHGGDITFVTMGPEAAVEVLAEALAWANARGASACGVHLCDPQLSGADVVMTSEALARVLHTFEAWDIVLFGAASVDAGTSMVPALTAALVDHEVIERVESLALEADQWLVRQEESTSTARIPFSSGLIVSCAERLCEPCKVAADRLACVDRTSIAKWSVGTLGLPSVPTPADRSRVLSVVDRSVARKGLRLEGSPEQQAREAWRLIERLSQPRVECEQRRAHVPEQVLACGDHTLEPRVAAEQLLGEFPKTTPRVVSLPDSPWGRSVAAHFVRHHRAAILSGVTAVEIRDEEVHAIRPTGGGATEVIVSGSTKPVVVLERVQPLDHAETLIGIGRGIDRAQLPELEALATALGAAVVASRKVADAGWMPRHLQIGVTGAFVAPAVYLAVGTSGSVNHTVGFQGARCVIAMNNDPSAPVFNCADIGMVGDGMELLKAFVTARIQPPAETSPKGQDHEGSEPTRQG